MEMYSLSHKPVTQNTVCTGWRKTAFKNDSKISNVKQRTAFLLRFSFQTLEGSNSLTMCVEAGKCDVLLVYFAVYLYDVAIIEKLQKQDRNH